MTSDELDCVNTVAQSAFAAAANLQVPLKWMTLSIPREGQKPLTVRCRTRYGRLMEYKELSK